MTVEIKRKIQHFWFIKELLHKILTTAGVFLGEHHNLEFAEFKLMNFIGAVLNHPAVIEPFAEIVVKKCKVKPYEDICWFSKAWAIVQKCLQLLRRNYYKKVMHVIQLSHVLQGEVVQVFFLFKHTHLLFSCKELTCLL